MPCFLGNKVLFHKATRTCADDLSQMSTFLTRRTSGPWRKKIFATHTTLRDFRSNTTTTIRRFHITTRNLSRVTNPKKKKKRKESKKNTQQLFGSAQILCRKLSQQSSPPLFTARPILFSLGLETTPSPPLRYTDRGYERVSRGEGERRACMCHLQAAATCRFPRKNKRDESSRRLCSGLGSRGGGGHARGKRDLLATTCKTRQQGRGKARTSGLRRFSRAWGLRLP